MKKYEPQKMTADSRYRNFLPTLSTEIQKAVHRRMKQLLEEEKHYCDKGNYSHMCQIITSIALYEVLQEYGKSEAEAYSIVSEEMWKFLDPSSMQKLARKSFFLSLMKKIVPFGFRKGSGIGWRYTWHDDDSKDEFHFECNECIYQKIPGKRNMMKLGTMCCHADFTLLSSIIHIILILTIPILLKKQQRCGIMMECSDLKRRLTDKIFQGRITQKRFFCFLVSEDKTGKKL